MSAACTVTVLNVATNSGQAGRNTTPNGTSVRHVRRHIAQIVAVLKNGMATPIVVGIVRQIVCTVVKSSFPPILPKNARIVRGTVAPIVFQTANARKTKKASRCQSVITVKMSNTQSASAVAALHAMRFTSGKNNGTRDGKRVNASVSTPYATQKTINPNGAACVALDNTLPPRLHRPP